MTTVEKEKPAYYMMRGTERGYDYLVIGRQGNVAVGVKPIPLTPGEKLGHENTTYVGARLRSAMASSIQGGNPFLAEDQKVVGINAAKGFAASWPNVIWEKNDDSRASTTIGALIPGSILNAEGAKELLSNMEADNVSAKLAKYLVSLLGEEHLILTVDEIAAWLEEKAYGQVKAKLTEAVGVAEVIQKEYGENIGNFGMQATILNKAFKATQGADEHAVDEEEGSEDDEPEEGDED